MKLIKKLTNEELSKNYKYINNYIYIFMIIFFMNNLKAFGSENKLYSLQNIRKDAELEKIYELKSIPYSKYDGLGGQLKTFFWLYSPKSLINNYPDLSIINTSDAIREGYRLKINDMTINKNNYKIKKEALEGN